MREILADIITIGDEILIGQIIDTNSSWIASELNKIGIKIRRKFSIADTMDSITEALDESVTKANLVIFTGGLGPTKDDVTKKALSDYFHSALKCDEETLQRITNFFMSRNRELTEANRLQAYIPECAEALPNHWGTAPGMLFEKNGCLIFSLPGVPYEMKEIMNHSVLKKLTEKFSLRPILHKTFLTQGIPESFLMLLIKDWEDSLPKHLGLAYLPSPGQVKLRLTNYQPDENSNKELEHFAEELHRIIGDKIFGYENDTLEIVIVSLLKQKGATLSFAESCSGGYLAHKLTSVPGSSAVFHGSIVAYSYDIKSSMLGVSEKDLAENGAVSEVVVRQMAEGVRKMMKSDYAISASGIAGPDGGVEGKPVGTVWIAIAHPDGVFVKKFLFGNDRLRNIEQTFLYAFEALRLILLGKDPYKKYA